MGADRCDNALDLTFGANHRPDMLDRLGALELHETGARHGMNGIAGGIGDEMKMEPGHAISPDRGVEKRRLIPVLRRGTAAATNRSPIGPSPQRRSPPRDKSNLTVLVLGRSGMDGDSIPMFQSREGGRKTRLWRPYTRFRPVFQAKAESFGINR